MQDSNPAQSISYCDETTVLNWDCFRKLSDENSSIYHNKTDGEIEGGKRKKKLGNPDPPLLVPGYFYSSQ